MLQLTHFICTPAGLSVHAQVEMFGDGAIDYRKVPIFRTPF